MAGGDSDTGDLGELAVSVLLERKHDREAGLEEARN
jgi:hypothetical protein